VAEDAVGCELVSAAQILANREKYREFCRLEALHCDFGAQSASEFNGFQLNSPRNGTGNFRTCIRENSARNREFSRQIFNFEF
jgi:hypothetical protein